MNRRFALLPLAVFTLACGAGRRLDTAPCEDVFTDAVTGFLDQI